MRSIEKQQETVKKSHSYCKNDYLDINDCENGQKVNQPLKGSQKNQSSRTNRTEVVENNNLKKIVFQSSNNCPKPNTKYFPPYPLKTIQQQISSIPEHNQNQLPPPQHNCNIRLFTFMQSTQKQGPYDNYKQNQCTYANSNELPQNCNQIRIRHPKVTLNPSIKTHKARADRQMYQDTAGLKTGTGIGQLVQNSKQQEIQLINFIQNSRKKRQQLLIQLQSLDFDCINNVCSEKVNFLTPSQQSINCSINQVKQRAQSSKNFNKKENYFINKNVQSLKKSRKDLERLALTVARQLQDKKLPTETRQIMRQRHFSAINFDQDRRKKSFSKLQLLNLTNLRRQDNKQKTPRTIIKQSNSQLSLKIIKPNDFKRLINIGKSTSRQSIKRQNSKQPKTRISHTKTFQNVKKQINQSSNDKQSQFSSNKIIKRQKKQTPYQTGTKNVDNLMKKKKQLESQLTNINDQIVFFNKKKKRSNKTSR